MTRTKRKAAKGKNPSQQPRKNKKTRLLYQFKAQLDKRRQDSPEDILVKEFYEFENADKYCKSYKGNHYCLGEYQPSKFEHIYSCISHQDCPHWILLLDTGENYQVKVAQRAEHSASKRNGGLFSPSLQAEIDGLLRNTIVGHIVPLLNRKYAQNQDMLQILPKYEDILQRKKVLEDYAEFFKWAVSRMVLSKAKFNADTDKESQDHAIVLQSPVFLGPQDSASVFITSRRLFNNLKVAATCQEPEGISLTATNFAFRSELPSKQWKVVHIGVQHTSYLSRTENYESQFTPIGWALVSGESVSMYKELFRVVRDMALEFFDIKLRVAYGFLARCVYLEKGFKAIFPDVRQLSVERDRCTAYTNSGIPGCIPVSPFHSEIYVGCVRNPPFQVDQENLLMPLVHNGILQKVISNTEKEFCKSSIGYFVNGRISIVNISHAYTYFVNQLFITGPAIPEAPHLRLFAFRTNMYAGKVREKEIMVKNFGIADAKCCLVKVDTSVDAVSKIQLQPSLKNCALIRRKYKCTCKHYFESGWYCCHVLCCGAIVDNYDISQLFPHQPVDLLEHRKSKSNTVVNG